MTKIAIILGSTRPGRNGEAVAKWVHEVADKRSDRCIGMVIYHHREARNHRLEIGYILAKPQRGPWT